LTESVRASFLADLLRGDPSACRRWVRHLLDGGVPIKVLYESLFQPSLYEVGTLWERNLVSVATEHMATALVERLMGELYPRVISGSRVDRSAVVASVENELHQIGGKMAADIFEMNGWDCHYLGADTPLDDLVAFAAERSPDVIGLSFSVGHHWADLERSLRRLASKFPALPILVGGQGLRRAEDRLGGGPPHIRPIRSLDELETFIRDFPGKKP
jgi:methanogenic corrinoid protein MtbC1